MRAAFVLAVALTFLVLLDEPRPADALLALVAATAFAGAAALPRPPALAASLRRLAFLPWLVLGFLIELARGSWTMLLVLLGLRPWRRLGLVELPFGERSERGAVVTAWLLSATPGSALCEVDAERRVLVWSVIDASDPERVRSEIDTFYRRFQRPVFP